MAALSAVDGGRGGKHEILDPGSNCLGNQRMRFERVVVVIGKRHRDRFRNHDRAGEVDDGVDWMPLEYLIQQCHVGNVTRVKTRRGRDRPAETGGKAINDHNVFAGIHKRPHNMAADVSRTTRNQYCHDEAPSPRWIQGTTRCPLIKTENHGVRIAIDSFEVW